MNEAQELIDYRNTVRKATADRIRELATLRKQGFLRGKDGTSSRSYRALVQSVNRSIPRKPSPYNLRREATALLRYARTPIRDYGGEYYSQCGMEDHEDMKRHGAQQDAVVAFQAWKILTGK